MALLVSFCSFVLLASFSSAPAAASEEPSPGGSDEVTAAPAEPLLEKPMRGRKAIEGLGDQLDVAAARNDLRPAELRTLLRADATVWVDPQGAVFYIDPAHDEAHEAGATPKAQMAPLSETFQLHSNPTANRTILLDFDGAYVGGTSWNTQSGVMPAMHPAWDPAGDGAAFSDSERQSVQQVWAMVAEDYAPFDVDVTTEDFGTDRIERSSSSDAVFGTRVLVTPSDDPFQKICNRQCGGVAYLNVYDRVGSGHQPAWVFPHALDNNAKNIAEAASHEAGHNLGLEHDGTATLGYYTGHGLWAPIMGVGYQRPLAQWSAGSYSGANNGQDDLAILTGYLGARQDEAAGSVATPATLPVGEAVIGTAVDVDAFVLGTCAAGAVVSVQPSVPAPNLDLRATLVDAAGVERDLGAPASGFGDGTTATGLGASLTVPGSGDGWVLTVEGVGEGSWAGGGYDDYASLGAYTVSAPGCDGSLADGVPGEPGGVVGSVGGTDNLTLTWSAPTTEGDGPVTGYVVSRSGSATTEQLNANTGSHTFTGLTAGTTYELSVRAVNATGAGRTVTVSARTTDPAPVAPSAPRDLTGRYVQGTGQIEAYWTEPASTGTAPISGYNIYVDGGFVGQMPSTSRGVALTKTGGFAEGQYVVGVAAVSSAGSSPTSAVQVTVDLPDRPANDDIANAVVLSGSGGVIAGNNTYATREGTDPRPPTPYTAGGYSVWYSWTPAQDGPVQMRTSGGAFGRDTTLAAYTGQPSALTQVAGADDTYVAHAGISYSAVAGTRYLIAVDGFTGTNGSGPFTLSWSQTVPQAPSAPSQVTAEPGDASATVSWTAPNANGSPITGYTVTASPGGATAAVGPDARSVKVTGLTNGTAYTFSVTATNDIGTSAPSAPSAPMTPAGVPDAPTGVTATAGKRLAAISWTPPAGNGAPVTEYTVTASPGGATATADGSDTTATVTGLDGGTAYSFTVTASNDMGTGSPSTPSPSVTPVDVPNPPTGVTATPAKASASVSWTAATANGSPITGYTVTASPGGAAATVAPEARAATLTGLTNGTIYRFTVTATSSVGPSAPSEPSSAIRPADVPDAPIGVGAVRGNRSATVSWTASAANGSPVIDYVVTASPGNASVTVTGGGTTATVPDLTNGTTYRFTVVATNAVGDSPASATSNQITPAGLPDPVAAPTAAWGDQSATITWTAASGNGSPIAGYTIISSPGGITKTITGGDTTTGTVTGLTNGTNYTFTVKATNAIGDSPASPPSNKVTPAGVPTTVAKPTAIRDGRRVTVKWDAPDSNGSPILGYIVTSNQGHSKTVPADSQRAVFRRLAPGVYKFRVTGYNAIGIAPKSDAVRITVR